MNDSEKPTYKSYLLRLWRDDPRSAWRASLRSTASEQEHIFADLGQMWAFLTAQLGPDGGEKASWHAPPGESGPGVADA